MKDQEAANNVDSSGSLALAIADDKTFAVEHDPAREAFLKQPLGPLIIKIRCRPWHRCCLWRSITWLMRSWLVVVSARRRWLPLISFTRLWPFSSGWQR